jgi:acyl transferase domain-containing protein
VLRAARHGLALEGLVPGAQRALTPHALRGELAGLHYRVPELPLISASLGRAFQDAERPDAVHYRRQLYHSAGAGDARDALLAQDCAVWFELGSAGSLSLAAGPGTPLRVAALHVGEDDMRCQLRALAALYTHGVELDFAAVDAPYPRKRVSLPPYPFERERHWVDAGPRQPSSELPGTHAPSSHPLITRVRLRTPHESGIDGGAEGTG